LMCLLMGWRLCCNVSSGAVHLFHHYHMRTESTLKVYKSSEKNDDGGRFHEIKHADPGS
jgi:uncharacterized protein YjlB